MNFRNPFVNRSMIKTPGEFVGRAREVKSILDRVVKMQCSSVVGERRIGKSSLLYYICSTYKKELGEGYEVIYLDLQRAKMHTQTGFLSEILKKFDYQNDVIKEDAGLLRNLCIFEEAIEELNEKIKPVICFDEFENITRRTGEFTDDFFESLRSLANSGKIAYITASKTSLYDLCRGGKLTSPFYNIFTNINLGKFSGYEADEFVGSSRVLENFNKEEIEFILNLGENHPFYLEIACWHVFEAKLKGSIDRSKIRKEFGEEISQYKTFKKEPGTSLKQEKPGEKESLSTVELEKELDEFKETSIFMLLGEPGGYYRKAVLDPVEYLVNKKNMNGVYLCISEPYEIISGEMKKRGINIKNLCFIDCISEKSGENEFCIYVRNPDDLEVLKMNINNIIGEIGAHKFLFIDDLSSFLIYNELRTIEEFIIKVLNDLQINKTAALIASIKEKTPKDLIDRISPRCDKIIYPG